MLVLYSRTSEVGQIDGNTGMHSQLTYGNKQRGVFISLKAVLDEETSPHLESGQLSPDTHYIVSNKVVEEQRNMTRAQCMIAQPNAKATAIFPYHPNLDCTPHRSPVVWAEVSSSGLSERFHDCIFYPT